MKLTIRTATTSAELKPYAQAWDALAASALDPNVFYEYWQLLPSMDAFAADDEDAIEIVLILEERDEGPMLRGVFPLERLRRFRGLPIRHVKLWKPLYCFSCTPLVDARCAQPVIREFIEWIKRPEARCELLELNDIRGDGPFATALSEVLVALGRPSFQRWTHQRALLESHAEAAQGDARFNKGLKQFDRRRRRLCERGELRFSRLTPKEDASPWIQDFLALEASGWKGREGSAMSSSLRTRRHFEIVAREAHARGRLDMQALHLDDRVIAMQCNYVGADAAYAFKCAYDEAYAQYSPGVLLELENTRITREEMSTPWMDSCAVPNHPTMDRIWSARRKIEARVVSNGRWANDWSVRLFPRLRNLKRATLLAAVELQASKRARRILESIAVALSATVLLTAAID